MHAHTRWLGLLLSACLIAGCGGGGTATPQPDAGPVGVPPTTPDPTPTPTTPVPTPTLPPVAVTAVGEALGPVAASARIDAAGGRLDAPDYSLSIIVPAGAFDRAQTVTLQQVVSHAPGARGATWRIAPEGVTAAKPVTLEWRPTAAERNGTLRLRIASQGADGVWRSAAAGSDQDGVVRTTTTHFSDWTLVAGAQILPGQTEVQLGQAKDLSVLYCHTSASPGKPDELQHHQCRGDDFVALGIGSTWSVNGVPEGNATLGTLVAPAGPSQKTARRYQAPAAVPSVNPVAVSVPFRDPYAPQDPDSQLVAHVTVVDPQAGCAWVRTVPRVDMALEIDWRFSGQDAQRNASHADQVRVSGPLLAEALQPIGQAVFRGGFDQGTVQVERRLVDVVTGEVTTVEGQGAPVRDPATPTVSVFLDTSTCRLLVAASAWTRSVVTRQSSRGTDTANENAGLDLILADVFIGGQRQWGQERLLPVRQQGEADPTRVAVSGESELFGSQAGTARVRWSLTPR